LPSRSPRLSKSLEQSIREILSIPTAPFHEHWLRDYLIYRFAKLPDVKLTIDRIGNLWVRYLPKGGGSPKVCLQAHLDHPGYVADKKRGRGEPSATGYGGLPENCVGAAIRFYSSPKDSGRRAVIKTYKKEKRTRKVTFTSAAQIEPGSVGMWDFPAFRRNGSWFEGRSFDDTLGVSILAVSLEAHATRRRKTPLMFVFTRAEEVGCVGLASIIERPPFQIPEKTITIEMPRATGELVAGNGVMLRAGDFYGNFDPDFLSHIEAAAKKVQSSKPWFRSQRRAAILGDTETSLFRLLGYRAGCLCLPVVHAHNINREKNGRPAPEKIHENDLLSLLTLLEHLLSDPLQIAKTRSVLKKRLLDRRTPWRSLLQA